MPVMSTTITSAHWNEIQRGDRFEFGKNWQRFLSVLDSERVEQATLALAKMLGVKSLEGKSFLDIGSGSGLSSLAARRLGAARIHSFDYDPESVACGRELQRRSCPESPRWVIEQGSVLDADYLGSLGRFDVVYSWGVLHHTGAMWQALENVVPLVADGGLLAIAIYNDQGGRSQRWKAVKKTYNALPRVLRGPFACLVLGPLEVKAALSALARFRPMEYVQSFGSYKGRGMSRWHDLVDWIGGYPYEVAKPEQIFDFYRTRGFNLVGLKTCLGNHGCNELVFSKGS
jgi:2-polyprenyl-6-hydroxyphenyl methylase/3-demethylubiquinone-9 3-methyltransferase